MQLPKVGNVASPKRQAIISAEQEGTNYRVREAALSKASRARMSEIVNSGAAVRQAMVSESQLKDAEARSDIVLESTNISKSKAETSAAVAESSAANIASRQANDEGLLKVFDTVLREFEKYDIRESKQQVQQYLLKQKEVAVAFDKTHGATREYSAGEVPEHIKALVGIPEDMAIIPAYMVQAEWKKSVLDQSLVNDSSSISNEELREQAINVARGYSLTNYSSSLEAARRDQPIYQKTKTLEAVNFHMQNRDFGLAIDSVENSQLRKEQKTELINDITNKQQDFTLTSIESLDPTDPTTIIQQKRALELMRERDEGTTGALTEAQFRTHRNALERSISDHKSASKKADDAMVGYAKEQASKASDLAWDGVVVGADNLMPIIEVLKKTDDEASRRLLRELRLSRSYADTIQTVKRMPINQQREIQKNATTAIQHSGIDDAFIYQKQIEAIQKDITNRQRDTVDWARSNNIMAFKDFDSDNIVASLRERGPVVEELEKHYESFSGYLSKAEAQEFGTFMNNQPVSERLNIMGQVVAGFNGDVVKTSAFFEQFKDDKLAGTMASAGQAFARGDAVAATKIFEGNDIRFNSPEYFTKEMREDTNAAILRNMGSAYAGSSVVRDMVVEAVYDTIAYDNSRLRTLGGDGVSAETINAAVTSVTGGLVDYNNSVVLSAPGLTPRETEGWLDDLHQSAFEATGHAKKCRDWLSDGTLKLIGVGANRYQLTDDSGSVVRTTAGLPFEFGYDKDYPSIKRSAWRSRGTTPGKIESTDIKHIQRQLNIR